MGLSTARRESNALLRAWCAEVTGDVLSIGSSHDGDNEGHTYRSYFTRATSYTTSEYGARALGCDLSLDVRAMPTVPAGRYDGVFCSGVLEHVDDYRAALAECARILAPCGIFLVGVPFRQAIHRPPQDFWRFTTYGLHRALTEAGFGVTAIQAIDADGPHVLFPAAYWARAVKP